VTASEPQLDPAPPARDAHHRIELKPESILRRLLIVIALLTILAIAAELARNVDAADRDVLPRTLRVIRRNFNPSAEQTVGTWFTAAMLLGAGLLLAAIGGAARAARDRWARHWLGLAAILVFLSCDEGASLHEQLGDWVKDVMPTGGPLLWAWVVPYSILAVAVGLAYLSFLRALPSDTRRRFILAAAIYVGGALVIEMIEAGITDYRDRGGGPVTVLAVIEETAEMAGVAYLIYALLLHTAAHSRIALSVADLPPSPRRGGGEGSVGGRGA
jgi:hypothetical protein